MENQLARRGVTTVELLADLRLDPENACTLPARTMCRVVVQPVGSAVTRQTSTAAVETLRTRFGCLVRLTIGEQQFVTVSGTVTLADRSGRSGCWHLRQSRSRAVGTAAEPE